MAPLPHITSFKVLSFDVYGTLIDWETGIHNAFLSSSHFIPLPRQHELKSSHEALLLAFHEEEKIVQVEQPGLPYSKVLSEVYIRLVQKYNIPADDGYVLRAAASKFGASVGQWPPFPDTLEAMRTLSKHFRLVALSNTDRGSIDGTLANTPIPFDATYIAEEIGSYKPDPRNFEYLFERVKKDFGFEKDQILHVAQSLFHDAQPATNVGLPCVWVDRKGVIGVPEEVLKCVKDKLCLEVGSMGELAEVVGNAFGDKGTWKA